MPVLVWIAGIAVFFAMLTIGFARWRIEYDQDFTDPLSDLLNAQQGRKPKRDRHAFGEWD